MPGAGFAFFWGEEKARREARTGNLGLEQREGHYTRWACKGRFRPSFPRTSLRVKELRSPTALRSLRAKSSQAPQSSRWAQVWGPLPPLGRARNTLVLFWNEDRSRLELIPIINLPSVSSCSTIILSPKPKELWLAAGAAGVAGDWEAWI